MRDERRIVRRLILEGYIVKPRLEINHTHPLRTSQLSTIASHVIQLVLVFVSAFVHGYYVLHNTKWLSGLLTWD